MASTILAILWVMLLHMQHLFSVATVSASQIAMHTFVPTSDHMRRYSGLPTSFTCHTIDMGQPHYWMLVLMDSLWTMAMACNRRLQQASLHYTPAIEPSVATWIFIPWLIFPQHRLFITLPSKYEGSSVVDLQSFERPLK